MLLLRLSLLIALCSAPHPTAWPPLLLRAHALQYPVIATFQLQSFSESDCPSSGTSSTKTCPYYHIWKYLNESTDADASSDKADALFRDVVEKPRNALSPYYQVVNPNMFIMYTGCSITISLDPNSAPFYSYTTMQNYVRNFQESTPSSTASLTLNDSFFFWNQPRLYCLYNAPILFEEFTKSSTTRAGYDSRSREEESQTVSTTASSSSQPTCKNYMPSAASLVPSSVQDLLSASYLQLDSLTVFKIFDYDVWYELINSPLDAAETSSSDSSDASSSAGSESESSTPRGTYRGTLKNNPSKICSAPAIYTVPLNALLAGAASWQLGASASWPDSITLTHNYATARVVGVVVQCSGVPLTFNLIVNFLNPGAYKGNTENLPTAAVYFCFFAGYTIILILVVVMTIPCTRRQRRRLAEQANMKKKAQQLAKGVSPTGAPVGTDSMSTSVPAAGDPAASVAAAATQQRRRQSYSAMQGGADAASQNTFSSSSPHSRYGDDDGDGEESSLSSSTPSYSDTDDDDNGNDTRDERRKRHHSSKRRQRHSNSRRHEQKGQRRRRRRDNSGSGSDDDDDTDSSSDTSETSSLDSSNSLTTLPPSSDGTPSSSAPIHTVDRRWYRRLSQMLRRRSHAIAAWSIVPAVQRWWIESHIVFMYAPLQVLLMVVLVLRWIVCIVWAVNYSNRAEMTVYSTNYSFSMMAAIFGVSSSTLLIPLEMLVSCGWGLLHTDKLPPSDVAVICIATLVLFGMYALSASCPDIGLSVAFSANIYAAQLNTGQCNSIQYARMGLELSCTCYNVTRMFILTRSLSRAIIPDDARRLREKEREAAAQQQQQAQSLGRSSSRGSMHRIREDEVERRHRSSSSSSSSTSSSRKSRSSSNLTSLASHRDTTTSARGSVNTVRTPLASAAMQQHGTSAVQQRTMMELYLRYSAMALPFSFLLMWPVLFLIFSFSFYQPEDYYMEVIFSELPSIYLFGFIVIYLRTSTAVY